MSTNTRKAKIVTPEEKAIRKAAKQIMRETGANMLTGRPREEAWLEARARAKEEIAQKEPQ